METIADLINAQARRYSGYVAVHTSIHGTDDPDAIADQVTEVCRLAFAAAPRRALFHSASVGSVTGVELTTGDEVVVKCYQPRWSAAFLSAVSTAQQAVAAAGLPCPVPLAGPLPSGLGLATVETYVADPGMPSAFTHAHLVASASGFADVVDACSSLPPLLGHPLHSEIDELYPEPHSPMFDFVATAAGAEWIDEHASIAKPLLELGTRGIAHGDWAARNVRLSTSGVAAIYDMDSLATMSIPVAMGQAAATWRATGEPTDASMPGFDEIVEWLDQYPRPLTEEDRRIAIAGALYVVAYTARCEHAIDPFERERMNGRAVLRVDGDRFAAALRA